MKAKFEVANCDCCGAKKVVCAVFANRGKKVATCNSCNNQDVFPEKGSRRYCTLAGW